MSFIKIIYELSFLFLLLTFILSVNRRKYLIVSSLIFWISFFYFCYIAFPCLCIDEINKRWSFSEKTLTYSRILVSFYNLFFSIYLYCFTKIDKKLKENIKIRKIYNYIYLVSYTLELLSTIILLLSILKLITIIRNDKTYLAYFNIREAAELMEAKFHLRLFLYLLISASFYLFHKKRKLIFFVPLVLVVVFETLAGKRTTAFIVLLYLYILYAVSRKRLALKLIVPVMLILLIGVLFSRAEAIGSKLDLNIIFGEFFESFTTLPYMIEYNLIGSGFKIERVLADYTFASFIPGTIKTHLISYQSVGNEIAEIIGRGYGLGSNFIFEQLYEFNIFGLITSLIIPLVLIYIDKKLKGTDNIIIKIVFVFQLRLYIREGITQFLIIFYILILYFGVFYFSHREIYYNEENKKNIKSLDYLSLVKEHKI